MSYKKRQRNKNAGYKCDSKWEAHLQGTCLTKCKYCPITKKGVLSNCIWKPEVVDYTKPETPHKYYPDAKHPTFPVLIEAKGRFWDAAEYKKYLYIREVLKLVGVELVFLFLNPDCPMPGAKVRKDGSINTHAGWAEKNNFRWFDETTIHTLLKGVTL